MPGLDDGLNADEDITTGKISVSKSKQLFYIDEQADDSNYFYDESDDFEQDEFAFVEPFDLAKELIEYKPEIKKENDVKTERESYCSAHIARVFNGSVAEVFSVMPAHSYRSDIDNIKCSIRHKKLVIKADNHNFSGVIQNGKKLVASDIPQKKGISKVTLQDGDFAFLKGLGGTYKIEVYNPPLAYKSSSFTISPGFLSLILIAIGLHISIGLFAWMLMPGSDKLDLGSDEEIFAEVKMEKPEFKKHEEEKKQKTKKKAVKKDATSMAERAPKVSRRAVKRIRERAKDTKTSSSVTNLLKVLNKGSGKPGASKNIKDLVSNIDAVAKNGSSGSSFSIAGAIGSLPGGKVNIAKSGGGGIISTLSGDQVAGKGSGIASLARSKKHGGVRGKVTKMSSGAKVKGSLSKAEITRVVNSHIHAIQACYERALMGNQGLSGRIVFDWTVTTKGRVKGVRVRSSTLGSSKVTGCISKEFRRWVFPRPKGGDVVITYPFLFRSVSS